MSARGLEMKLTDRFEHNGLIHTRIVARPDRQLRGLRKFQIGPIAFDVFGDFDNGDVYARAYLSQTGEVAWYAVAKVTP